MSGRRTAGRGPIRTAAALSLALAACAGARPPGKVAKAPPAAPAPLAALAADDAAAARRDLDALLARERPGGGDPVAHLGAALLAGRALDAAGEATHLLAAIAAAPSGPIALLALRRLAELAETSPERARQVIAGLDAIPASAVQGLAAYRSRVARVAARDVLGDHEAAGALRRENGAATAWTLAGPFGRERSLDFEAVHPPDRSGEVPERLQGPAGLPARASRLLPAPDGTATLEGEPMDEDVYFLASDVTLERGGRYLLTLGTTLSARVRIDGAVALERKAWAEHAPTLLQAPVELSRGAHRVLVKVARSTHRSGLHLALSRADGAPSDAAWTAGPPGPPPSPPPAAPRAGPVLGARELAASLEPAIGFLLARVLAARDARNVDREGAKALLAEAAKGEARSALLHAARADLLADDPSLDRQAARARAESDLRAALERDPGNAAARLSLVDLLADAERLDDAAEALAGLDPDAARRPAALEQAAAVAEKRGLAERAEALAGEAIAAEARCGAVRLAHELAVRRQALAREGELAALGAACRDGRERLAEHLQRRGDPRGAADALLPVVRARPWAVDPGLALAAALVAAGELSRAAEAVEALRAVWPRSPRILVRLADVRELAGDRAGARSLRELALLLDGSDLSLRRALALEDGREVLDDLAEDAPAAIRAYERARRSDDTSSSMVLDAAAVEIHPGGDATERTHQVIHVLDQRGVEQFGEVSLPAGAEVLKVRTRKPDGRTLEPERAGGAKGSISLAGLEPRDYLEIEYLRAVRGQEDGYAGDPFYFQVVGTRLFRSSYAVVAREGLGLAADSHGMPAPPVAREAGRDVIRALRTDVPAFVPEPGSVPLTEVLPFLQVGTGGGREATQRALSEAAADGCRPTEELRALAREVRAAAGAAPSPAALARTAYARVAGSILGGGGGTGEDASVVLSRGRGSRLVVLKALLAELGLRARFALVRPFSSDPAAYRFAPAGLYSQPLLRVEAGGETIWLDPSSRHAPFGAIPGAALDAEALVLAEPGEPLEVTRTPARALVEDRRELAVRVVLAADGGAELSGSDTYRGALAGSAKAAVERLDTSERRQAVEALLSRAFRGISVGDLSFAGEDDPEAPLVIRWTGRARDLGRPAGGGLSVDAPILPAALSSRFVQVAARRTPLLVPAEERTTQRIEIVPPEGLRLGAGDRQSLATPYGSYERTERAEGNSLVREERLELQRGRVAPERYGDFAAFAAAVDAAQERPVLASP